MEELIRAMRRAAAAALGRDFGGVGLFEEPLAMQVAGLDVIAVDEGEAAHTGAGQRGGVETAERAASGDDRMRIQERFLPAFPDAGEEDLPRVALAIGGVHALRW